MSTESDALTPVLVAHVMLMGCVMTNMCDFLLNNSVYDISRRLERACWQELRYEWIVWTVRMAVHPLPGQLICCALMSRHVVSMALRTTRGCRRAIEACG